MIFEFFMLLLQAEMRIKKLDIFIAKQFGLLFVGTFFICQFVLMMQFLWRYIDELIGKKVVVVCNLKTRKIRGVESQGMILAKQKRECQLHNNI